MSNNEIKEYTERFKKFMDQVHSKKETSLAFLNEAGIIDKDGKLTENYFHVPAKEKQLS